MSFADLARELYGEVDDKHKEWLDKFRPKHTTDDCFTPEPVYEAVLNWCLSEYGLTHANIMRPFYPGGDYENENYDEDSVVIDNPPFSILSKITRFYQSRKIKYFLFAPALTVFSTLCINDTCAVCTGVSITYENGAVVNTSFVTNMENLRARSAPDLYKLIQEANKIHKKEKTKSQRKISFPDHVATGAKLNYLAAHGVELRITKEESIFIRGIDDKNTQIFGGGLLLSEKVAAEKVAAEKAAAEKAAAEKAAAEKAAAEKATAEKLHLSIRETNIIKSLSKEDKPSE